MARERLVQQAVEHLLDRIVGGEWADGGALPPQPQLAEELQVSRLTVREAVETLRSWGVVDVVHGSGTFLCPTARWSDVGALSRVMGRRTEGRTVARQVVEVRRMIEIGAAEIAAGRRTDDDLKELARLVARARQAHDAEDVAGFEDADLAFHTALMRACHNPFVPTVYEPLMRTLRASRSRWSAVPEVRVHAVEDHRRILLALRGGDPVAAREEMIRHMDRVASDTWGVDADAAETDGEGAFTPPIVDPDPTRPSA